MGDERKASSLGRHPSGFDPYHPDATVRPCSTAPPVGDTQVTSSSHCSISAMSTAKSRSSSPPSCCPHGLVVAASLSHSNSHSSTSSAGATTSSALIRRGSSSTTGLSSGSPLQSMAMNTEQVHNSSWANDSTPRCVAPHALSSSLTWSSTAPSTSTVGNMACSVATRHMSLEQRFSSATNLRLDARNGRTDNGSTHWTRDENAASRRYSTTSSAGSGSSAIDRCSTLSAASSSTERTSLSDRSTSPAQSRDVHSKDTLCEVKMPISPPCMPLPQTPPKESKVEVMENEDDFVVTVWLPHFNRDLITVSRRRTQALHIVADNYCGQNAGHFERLIELEGEGDEGPSSSVKAEFIAEKDTLVIKVLKRRQRDALKRMLQSANGNSVARERAAEGPAKPSADGSCCNRHHSEHVAESWLVSG